MSRNFGKASLRGSVLTALVLAVGACAPTMPDSGAGPSTRDLRQAQREAVSAVTPATGRSYATDLPGVDPAGPAISTSELSAAGIPVAQGSAPQPLPAASGSAAVPPVPGSGAIRISDEQDFDAVSSRESIETDKARLERNRAAYQEVAATELPSRPGQSNTRVIDFALATSNPVGQAVHKRPAKQNMDKFYRACAKYPSQDVAQDEFLRSGGPQKDSKGVDPDGDGFACYWDPTPFRLAKQGAVGAPVAREVLPGQLEAGALGAAGGVMERTSTYDATPLQ